MYLVFDTETTGLAKSMQAPYSDTDNWPRMVQISWQLHDVDGSLIENKDYIIRPEGFDIPYKAAEVHKITTEIAQREGQDLKEILLEFKEVLSRTRIMVGHNLEFDLGVLGSEFFRKSLSFEIEDLKVADTMHIGTEFCKLSWGRAGYKPPRLGELYRALFEEDFDLAHNSAADVNATARAFFELLRLNEVPLKELGISEPDFLSFKQNNPTQIQSFDIVVKKQAEEESGAVHKTKKAATEIDLGSYFNFHNHSIYSSLQGSSSLTDLINEAFENEFPAVGLVDLGNMMGAFKFNAELQSRNSALEKEYKAYEERKTKALEKGEEFNEVPPKKPIVGVIGCEFYLSERPEQKQFTKDDPDKRSRVVLLAKNRNGYRNLAKLSSLGYVNGFYFGDPRISKQMVKKYKEDLIAISGGLQGDIPQTILELGNQKGEELTLWWKETFGEDFYLQIQSHGVQEENHVNSVLVEFSEKHSIPLLAQNETYYSEASDAKIQEILSCIKDGEKLSTEVGRGFGKRKALPSKEYYLKNRKELKNSFAHYPTAFSAYEDLLKKFEPYSLKRDVLLPEFAIPEEFQSPLDLEDGGKRGENAYLRHLTMEGAKARYEEITPEIQERIDFELEVIANTGYPGYFLIVQDFCNEARKMGVWVGPGRGSAAGSAVAYCTGITNVDPIKYDLLFERFLNPERISMPDIDIDFDDEGRDRVIKWVIEKYGKTNVAQIITYSVLGGKSAIKDAGRVLELSIGETNELAKLIPPSPGMNFKKAFAKYDKLPSEDQMLVDEMKRILADSKDPRHAVLSAAQKLEGAIRNTGIHACGVIITPEDISNLVPISIAAKDSEILVSQFDNSVAENAGLLKMDFLGLRTLTILKDALKLIKKNHGVDIDIDTLPLDDTKTYELFQRGHTVGIFQYESPGMQKYMRELRPTVFADLIAMNALYRPGPIKYIPSFINRKHGEEEIVYDLPEAEEYLKETYGITVYQEQVMLLSQKLAGFTKGEADTLRKAMGKKLKSVLDELYPKFMEGGKQKGHDEGALNKIWKDWEAFAEYAFNKSHSTCYALIAYQTAYLKANYPAEYMASVMTHNLNNTKQITLFMEDCRSIGVDVLGPDVNESHYEFAVNEKGQIRFGLGAIKGIGEGPSEAIVHAREGGRFKSVYDFFERIPSREMNKRVVESLVIAGAFDELDSYHRAQYFEPDTMGKTTLERLLRYGQSFQEGKNEIENSLFADFADEVQIETPKIVPSPEWPSMYKLNKEKEIIGFYLSSHPLDEFKFQFEFLQGQLSKQTVLEDSSKQIDLEKAPVLTVDSEVDLEVEDVLDLDLESEDMDALVGLEQTVIEPRGPLGFLNLDEIDSFRDQQYGPEQIRLYEEIKDYKEKQRFRENAKEYMVSGLITEYTVRDGRNSGEKIAFLTLEDYSGSYSFRLGDRDYLRLRDRLDLQRFVILKIKFSIAKDSRVFVNVTEVFELKEAFDKFAKSLSLVLDVVHVRREDFEFLKRVFAEFPGEQKLKFYLKDSRDRSHMELSSLSAKVEVSPVLLSRLKGENRYSFYLNNA